MSIGENIRRLRKEANLTQEELAELLGVARSTITQWEGGWSMPRMGKLRLIAEVLHTSYSNIVSEEPNIISQTTQRAMVPLLTMSELELLHIEYDGNSADIPRYSSNDEENFKYAIEVPSSLIERHARACAVIAEDDHMNRIAPKGMAMVFDPALKPSNGQVAILHIQEHGIVVRRWFRGSNTLMLVADSHVRQDDIVLSNESPVGVIGTVVWVQSPRELE